LDNEQASVIDTIRCMLDERAANVLVSRAADAALAYIENEAVQIKMPRLEPNEFRGRGDSMTAERDTGLARELAMPDILRLATAAGALNVTGSGLGTGQRDEIERFSRRIDAVPLAPGPTSAR
jgi:1-phosphofructokinase